MTVKSNNRSVARITGAVTTEPIRAHPNGDSIAAIGNGCSSALSPMVCRDVGLVQRCLTNDRDAWEELYDQCHLRLLRWIRYLLNHRGRDEDLVEEIAARVWFALVRDNARLLARYDSQRNAPLFVFVHAIARYEALMFLRAERRRRSREAEQGVRGACDAGLSDCEMSAILDEFTATLTPGERQFLEKSLLTGSDRERNPLGLTDTTIWERRHRIRKKVRAFFD